jgi:hypothetical protein
MAHSGQLSQEMGKNSTKLAVICTQNGVKQHKIGSDLHTKCLQIPQTANFGSKIAPKCVFLLPPHTFICRVPQNNWQAFQNNLQYIPYLTPPSPPSTLSPCQVADKFFNKTQNITDPQLPKHLTNPHLPQNLTNPHLP